MITLTYKENEIIHTTTNIDKVLKVPKSNFLWLDVFSISEEEKLVFVQNFNINLKLPKKKRIRHSFRFIEKENELMVNTGILIKKGSRLVSKPVTFFLEDNFLVSYHNIKHLSFKEVYAEIKLADQSKLSGKLVFLRILEKILEFDIDIIENITGDIAELNHKITIGEGLDENMIHEITSLQEVLIGLRRNIIDKQRVLSSISKSDYFSKKILQKHLAIIEKDIHSILDYSSFDFERLESLQDTLMGLINMRQNVIMKIFTIVSVIFLPPTLIASIYGMNFADMPELNIPNAYPIAVTIMVFVSLLSLLIFKLKKWI